MLFFFWYVLWSCSTHVHAFISLGYSVSIATHSTQRFGKVCTRNTTTKIFYYVILQGKIFGYRCVWLQQCKPHYSTICGRCTSIRYATKLLLRVARTENLFVFCRHSLNRFLFMSFVCLIYEMPENLAHLANSSSFFFWNSLVCWFFLRWMSTNIQGQCDLNILQFSFNKKHQRYALFSFEIPAWTEKQVECLRGD